MTEFTNLRKLRLLRILQILYRESDAEHPQTIPELLARLEAEEIPCDRRSVSFDIGIIKEAGYEVH